MISRWRQPVICFLVNIITKEEGIRMRYIVTGVDGQLASRIAETVLAEVGVAS